MSSAAQRYLVGLGSNMRHRRHGAPAAVLRAALRTLDGGDVAVVAAAGPAPSRPLGPSRRQYANGAALIETRLDPADMLMRLQAIERAFGRRRRGRRWGARVLDLDLILWSGGRWRSPGLTVPHPQFRRRAFVLVPAALVAPYWRDPLTGLALAQLAARLTRPRPHPTARSRVGP